VIVWGNQRVIRQGQGEGIGDAEMAEGHDVTEQSHLMISMAQSSGQSSWLQIQMSRVRFLALLDFLRSDGSRTECTQSREYN
jgi:hypothetical protein